MTLSHTACYAADINFLGEIASSETTKVLNGSYNCLDVMGLAPEKHLQVLGDSECKFHQVRITK